MNDNRLVTIFGGSGFIGRHLVKRLAWDGWRIQVVSRTPHLCGHLQPLGEVGQIVVQCVDLNDQVQLRGLLRNSKAVVNLIGILHETRRQRFADIHSALPARLAEAAKSGGVERFVHLSALGAGLESESAYARTKAKGEADLRASMPEAVILRPSIVIGPEDQFFNRFAAIARLSPVLPLIGGGETRFQPVHVGDVAAAILAALVRDLALGQLFELGGPRVYSFAELMRYLLEVVQRRRLLVPISFPLAARIAMLTELMPHPLLTRDQVALLKSDNVVSGDAKGMNELDVAPTPIELVVPAYLTRYRAQPVQIARL